jgi:Gpi18-like mannosyltransferase
MERRSKWLILIATCIAISAAGLVIHSIVPSEIDSMVFTAVPGSPAAIETGTSTDVGQAYTYHMELSFDSTGNNVTFAILNASEFQRFEQGIPIGNLTDVKGAGDFLTSTSPGPSTDATITFDIASGAPLYLVFASAGPRVYASVFWSLLPVTFYPGFVIMACGIGATVVALAFFLTGWKRWFTIGAGINSAIFLARVASIGVVVSVPSILANVFNVEVYSDFQFQTLIWTTAFSHGVALYSKAVPIAYPFLPLYVETCWLFNLLPMPVWKMAIPLLGYQLATAWLVYRIVLALTSNEKRARVSMMLYFLNPFVLVYGSFAWLTPPPFVFFVVLSFYLALRHRQAWSMVAMGIAIVYKQYAIVFFPLVLIALLRARGPLTWKKLLHSIIVCTLACGGTIAVGSMPYLVTNPVWYLNYVLLSQAGEAGTVQSLIMLYPSLGLPVPLTYFFLIIGAPSWLTTGLATLLVYNIPLAACGLAIFAWLARYKLPASHDGDSLDREKQLFTEALFLALILTFCLHIFYSRGAYKYYFILLAPFISIFYDPKDLDLRKASSGTKMKFRWSVLIPILILWFVVFCYRYVYLIVLLGLAVYLVIEKADIIAWLERKGMLAPDPQKIENHRL